METLIAFCWHRCDTKPIIGIVEDLVKIAEASGIKKYIAIAVWCLGKSHHQIASYCLAYEHLRKAYGLFNALPAEQKLDHLAGQCGIDLVDAARFVVPRRDKVVLLAEETESKCATLSDDLIHGRSLVFIGMTLREDQRQQDALSYLDRASAMLRAVGNHSHLANAYQVLTRVHYYEHRLPEALDAVMKSWKAAELSDSPFFQAFIAVDVGMVLYSLNRDAEARTYIEIALTKALYVGDMHSVALALDYMGYGYLRQGDYRNAYSAYEEAVGKFHGTNEIKGEKYCRDNLARLKQKQMNPDSIIGFRRPGLDNDDSLFYPPGVIK